MNLPETLTAEEYNRIWLMFVRLLVTLSTLPETGDFPLWQRYPYRLDGCHLPARLPDTMPPGWGSDTMKGFASFAYDDDKGVLLNTYARKFSAKANLTCGKMAKGERACQLRI